MKICTAAQMRSIDSRTINEFGIPGIALMERAGCAVAEAVKKLEPQVRQAVIMAGTGNNGGDGFVVARELLNAGLKVMVYIIGKSESITGDSSTNLSTLEKLGIPVLSANSADSIELPYDNCVIIDAIFGTGLSREIAGLHATAIQRINDSGLPVVAVDMPSGVCSDTGRVLGCAVRADETVTFGLPKRGHMLYPGPVYCGRLTIADIGFPKKAVDAEAIRLQTIESVYVSSILPPRPPDGHKGTFGHLLVVAGSAGKAGAASLAGLAALRTGCGLVTLAVPEGIAHAISRDFPEAMTLPLPQTADGTIAALAIPVIVEAARRCSAIAMGPGLSVNADIMEVVRELLLRAGKPTVIDADAINALMCDAGFLGQIKRPIALTPHPAEFGRLIERETVEIQSDRIGIACGFAAEYGHVLALKGAHTVIACPDGRAFMNLTGNSGMATAGSGDVLTGVTGALLASGMSTEDAVVAAVHVHGMAGDIAAEAKGERSMIATDMIEAISKAFTRIEEI
ncbi:MAG: NAD(P)H-hydrate dehydratase [Nitrospirae bacterium]|nr:NAD(P)H-hydrate dehydratase [Nitrospirota bacterium]